MTVATSRGSYEDCFDLMDQALDTRQGIRVRFPTNGSAMYFRMRLHKARTLDRDDNLVAYSKGDPLYGRSIYDPVVATIEKAGEHWWLYLKKYTVEGMHVEVLDDEQSNDRSEPEMAESIETKEPVTMRRV